MGLGKTDWQVYVLANHVSWNLFVDYVRVYSPIPLILLIQC